MQRSPCWGVAASNVECLAGVEAYAYAREARDMLQRLMPSTANLGIRLQDVHLLVRVDGHVQVTVETGAPSLAMRRSGKVKPRMTLLQLPCTPANQIICDNGVHKVTGLCSDAHPGMISCVWSSWFPHK